MASAKLFTAPQIALCLGISPNAIRDQLSATPSELVMVKGQPAKGYAVVDLPSKLCARLADAARERGHRTAEDLLAEGLGPWRPPVPWEEIAQPFQQAAVKWRDALADLMRRRRELPAKEWIDRASMSCRQVHGYPVKDTRIQYVADRADNREKGFRNYQRVELYLDEGAFRQHKRTGVGAKLAALHQPVDEIYLQFKDSSASPADDRAWLFHSVFLHFETLLSEHPQKAQQRAIKKSLIDDIFSRAPGLSKTAKALRRVFELKLKQWIAGGRTPAAIRDSRPFKSGNHRRPDFAEDEQKIITLAVQHDGNESLAYRKLRASGQLSKAFTDYYEFDPRRRKSYMAQTTRDSVTSKVESQLALLRGLLAYRNAGPHFDRDWNGVEPGDWFGGDDVTWNHYFRYVDGDGRTRLTRGECLLLADLKTGYPLVFSLIAGHYNSAHIKSLILRVHDILGLPHKGFQFENGVWRSRLVCGERQNRHRPLVWRDSETGLKTQLGLRFRHTKAHNARSKPIEGIFGILQNLMQSIPGDVGRNEQTDPFERERELRRRAEKGDAESLLQYPTMEDWRNTIQAKLDEFAHDPQNGKMNPGVSPAEAWEAGLGRRPLRKLNNETRYILATHQTPARVTEKGIALTIRGRKMHYFNGHTGALLAQGVRDVVAFYNVEAPELLTVSDVHRQNYFSVKRVVLPAMDATNEQFREANAARRDHCAPVKVLYGNIQHRLISTIVNDDAHSENDKQMGGFISKEFEAHQAEQADREKKLRQISRRTGGPGFQSEAVHNPDRVLEGITMDEEIRAELALESASKLKPDRK